MQNSNILPMNMWYFPRFQETETNWTYKVVKMPGRFPGPFGSLCAFMWCIKTITCLPQWLVDVLPAKNGEPLGRLPSCRKNLHENCDGHSLAMQSSQLQKGPRCPTSGLQPNVLFILAEVLHYITYLTYLLLDIGNKNKSLGYTWVYSIHAIY